MKYKKGSIVEVFFKDEVCYYSWRCAQIVSGNGHNYTVSYDVYPGFTDKEDVEHVSVKSIRPCPPLLEISESWIPGDVVEVFHTLSWKMAIVTKDCGWDHFLVRLVGSFQEFEVNKSELRVRQTYKNGVWIVIDKVPRDYKDASCAKLLEYGQNSGSEAKRMDTKGDFNKKDLIFDAENNRRVMESCIVSSKTLKRASPCFYSQDEANEGCAQKLRKSEKEGRRLRVLGTSPEKVDAVANRNENVNGTYGYSHPSRLELNDTASVTSSSSSCGSNSYKPYEMHHESRPVEDFEGNDSDAESACQLGYQKDTDQSLAYTALPDDIHRQELNAYRCTMEALHASGPLTWEKEEMVTNLRMSLHISNDEHLIILRYLNSAASNSRSR